MAHKGGPNSWHNWAVHKALNLMNPNTNIVMGTHGLVKQTAQLVADNRTRLEGSVDAIWYLMKQGLPCRGHDKSEDSLNRGNFLELLKVLCQCDVSLAKVAFNNAPQNDKLVSSNIQKDIIHAHTQLVRKQLDDEQGDSYYCIVADETRDASKKEQLALVNRFVDRNNGDITERLVDLKHIMDTSAETLFNTITAMQSNRGRPIFKARGQGYDGASNMSGKINGLQKMIKHLNELAYYGHCWAHNLQLALVAACRGSIPDIALFFLMISDIVNVASGSCKRNDQLLAEQKQKVEAMISELILETGRGKNQETALARPGDTRWSSFWWALWRLVDMFHATITVIQNVESSGNTADQQAEASRLLEAMLTFKFAFILHLMEQILMITHDLSQALQKKDQDIVNAMQLLDETVYSLESMRSNGYNALLSKVTLFCHEHDNEVPKMSVVYSWPGHPHRNAQMDMNDHVYRIDLYTQVFDKVLVELNYRFNAESVAMLRLAACLCPWNQFEKFDVVKLVELATVYYHPDFPDFDLTLLEHQLACFQNAIKLDLALKDIWTLPELSRFMVKSGRSSSGYDLVFRLLTLILTLPISTATAERVFSALKLIKTRLRTSIREEYLNDAILLYVEKDAAASISNEEIMSFFANMKTRRSRFE